MLFPFFPIIGYFKAFYGYIFQEVACMLLFWFQKYAEYQMCYKFAKANIYKSVKYSRSLIWLLLIQLHVVLLTVIMFWTSRMGSTIWGAYAGN